jgi:glutathione synthase
MSRNIGVVMDTIARIKIRKDSTFAMLLAAQARDWQIWYMEPGDLWSANGRTHARMRRLKVQDRDDDWFSLLEERVAPLDELDAILMRKDPPFDIEYITLTYLLDDAERRGTLVVNHPASLRNNNEKVAATLFPDCCPPTLIAKDRSRFLEFLEEHGDIVVKPLDTMGGESVFRVRRNDPNTNVILETITQHDRRAVMAQRFIPEISAGDKRILLVDGEVVPYALARIPREGELRGNLAAGGTARGVPLTERDAWIARRIGPYLREQGVLFAGIDVIGDYLTEINITSPTCIRELDAAFGMDIAGDLMAVIEARLSAS